MSIDTVMLGRFVAQYEEGAQGVFIDADEAQEVALQIKAALALGEAIMDEVHADLTIPTEVACKVYAAIKRASVDTLLKGQDAKQGLAGTEGSAVGATSAETPEPGPIAPVQDDDAELTLAREDAAWLRNKTTPFTMQEQRNIADRIESLANRLGNQSVEEK